MPVEGRLAASAAATLTSITGKEDKKDDNAGIAPFTAPETRQADSAQRCHTPTPQSTGIQLTTNVTTSCTRVVAFVGVDR